MRILVIGNSYAAAFKRSERSTQHEVKFAAFSDAVGGFEPLRGYNNGEGLKLKDSAHSHAKSLWLSSTGSDGPLMLSPFATFLVIGLIRAPNACESLLCPQQAGIPPRLLENRALVSFAVYKRASQYLASVKEAQRVQSLIRESDPDRRVWFIPYPNMRDDAHVYDEQYGLPSAWLDLTIEERNWATENEKKLYARFFSAYGVHAVFPPDSLLVDGSRCPARFSVGALGSGNFLDDKSTPQWGNNPTHSPQNFLHKNKEYGEVWWQYLDTLLAHSPSLAQVGTESRPGVRALSATSASPVPAP